MGTPKQLILELTYVPIDLPIPCEDNPRILSPEMHKKLKESMEIHGFSKPIVLNSAKGRENRILEGHQRLLVAKEMDMEKVPVVYISVSDPKEEEILRIAYNKITADWDMEKLAKISEDILKMSGFSTEELDEIFEVETTPEMFDLAKELKKLDIKKIEIQKGDIWQLGAHKMMCGDSTIEADILKLMGEEKADMCFCDPPYILNYLKGKKKNGKPTEGFGYKRDRKYLETDVLPPDFTEKWMANVHKVQKENFNIIVYENWKNLRTIWGEIEKYWKVRNMIVWHVPTRCQGFSAKYKFHNKHDIAMVGTSEEFSGLNLEKEEELLQNDYETALYATAGKPWWESYKKGKKYCPSDFIEFNASDEKNSQQGVIFGTKPIDILIPYIKVLTKRDDLILETFGGSGSTLIAAEKMKRRCYLMEKSPVYAEVIRKRWEKLTGKKSVKLTK